MGTYFGVKRATGRTYCRLCRQHLQEGQLVIIVGGYNTSGQSHLLAEDCPYIQRRLEELE